MKTEQSKFKAVMFDLDGTLLDTLTDIADSVNAVLARFGFPTHSLPAYRYFVGDGQKTLVRRILPAEHRDEVTVSKCCEAITNEYHRRWPDNTRVYDGIPELLTAIDELGLGKVILSNKPHGFTRVMVERLLPNWSFDVVQGLAGSMRPKPDPTSAMKIAARLNIAPMDFLYLGDTSTDMQTATAAGMYAVGALWGFRTADELLTSGAKALAKEPGDVLAILRQKAGRNGNVD